MRDALDRVPAEPRSQHEQLTWMMKRLAAAADCLPCKSVLAAGRADAEIDQRLLFDFGWCAEKEQAWALARDAFEGARVVETVTTTGLGISSAFV